MIIDYITGLMGAGTTTSKGDETRWSCPFCSDRKKRMYVHNSKHIVFCQNCGYTGSVVKLIADLEKITYHKAFGIYKEYNGIFVIPENVRFELDMRLNLGENKYLFKTHLPLPEKFSLLENNNSFYAKKARRYLHKRGVDDFTIHNHKWGVCHDGKYEGRAILTIYEEDTLKFWVARASDKKAFRKELSPTNENWQVGKSEVIFNIDRASKMFGAVVLAEGIFDATTFGDIGGGLLGKRVSEAQLQIILKYKKYLENGVYIALDEDARSNAMELASELYQYMPVYLCDIKGDPNDMGKSRCMKALSEAVEYSPLSKVRSIFYR